MPAAFNGDSLPFRKAAINVAGSTEILAKLYYGRKAVAGFRHNLNMFRPDTERHLCTMVRHIS